MSGIATGQIFGRLTRDPETQAVGDTTKTSFSIAVNDGWGDKEHVSYFDVEMWGERGKVVQQYLGKGDPICVSGNWRQDRWQSDGQRKSKTYLKANDFSFAGRGDGGNSGGGGRREVSSDYESSMTDDEIPF